MSQLRFIGVDASMSNVGFALGSYNVQANNYLVERIGLIHTEPSKEKTVRKSSQDYERCRHLYTKLQEVFAEWNPTIAFAEMPTGSQSANGMKSYGISLMLLGTIKVPVIQVTPIEVKVAAVGDKTASKEKMIEWATAKWPHVKWATRRFQGKTEFLNSMEHPADACGAIEAGMRTAQWLQLVAVLAGQHASPQVII